MSVDRNTGWLPEGFEIKDLDAPRRMAHRVQTRVVVHRKRVRMAQGVSALVALAVLLGVAPLLWRSAAPQQAPSQMAAASTVAAPSPVGAIADREPSISPSATAPTTASSTLDIPHSTSDTPQPSPEVTLAEVTLAKSGQGVELAWHGNPAQEFVVYRCTSPKFDRCDVAGVVKGTRWVDSGKETAPVVFYRVEPKA